MNQLNRSASGIRASVVRCAAFCLTAMVSCGPSKAPGGVPKEGITFSPDHRLDCSSLPLRPLLSAFDIAGEHFVSVETDGTIMKFDLATGALSQVVKLDVESLPNFFPGQMLVSVEDGVMVLAGSTFNELGELILPIELATGRMRARKRVGESMADPILLPGRTLVLARRDPDWSNRESVELVDALDLTSIGGFSPFDVEKLFVGTDCTIARLQGNPDGSRLYIFAQIGGTSKAYALSRTANNQLSLIGTATLETDPSDVVFPQGSDEMLVLTQLLKTSELTWMAKDLSSVRTRVNIDDRRPYRIVLADSNRVIVAGDRDDLILVDRERGVLGVTTVAPNGLIILYEHPHDAHCAVAQDRSVSLLRWASGRR